ncbi:hypothetical protein ACFUZA_03040 [Streptomyces cellulosae]|uniref:Uncharacterized protein n=1 Tax=Streptomyces cellulosae TaxID=1968 RepID=A0ABW6JJQ0_STRCE
MRYRGHWGIGVRRREGETEIVVLESEESPIRAVLAGSTVTVAPRETRTLTEDGGKSQT